MNGNNQCGHARFSEDQICKGCGYSAVHIINNHYKPEIVRHLEKILELADTIGRYENSIANLSADVLKQAKEIERLKGETNANRRTETN